MITFTGTPGKEETLAGIDAAMVRILGKKTEFKQTAKNKAGIAKLKELGIDSFQRLVYGKLVFTTHDDALIKLIENQELGKLVLEESPQSTPETPRVDVLGYASLDLTERIQASDQRAKWADPKTYQDNPNLIGKIPNLNDLATASVE